MLTSYTNAKIYFGFSWVIVQLDNEGTLIMNLVRAGLVLALALVASLSYPSWAHDNAKWHDLSTKSKGMTIISAGLADVGKSGGTCKVWVQNVVTRATGGVQVPKNTKEVTDSWEKDTSGHISNLGKKSIATSKPGDIVQMIVTLADGTQSSHTAIVASNNGKEITWLESNWPIGSKVSSSRKQSIANFKEKTVSYTVYRVK